MLDLLHIQSLRHGADGRNTQAPNAANYDESKANPEQEMMREQAAKTLGIQQPHVSLLMRNRASSYSVGRLMESVLDLFVGGCSFSFLRDYNYRCAFANQW